MANIVIYPKNIYSKPKYDLQKRNIIKNPKINTMYSESKSESSSINKEFGLLNFTSGEEVKTVTIKNQLGLTTYLRNYENNDTEIYRKLYYEDKSAYPYGYFTYAIVKCTLYPNGDDFIFGNNNIKLEGNINSVVYDWRGTGTNDTTTYRDRPLIAFYKDIDIDNLVLTKNNVEDYFYVDANNEPYTHSFAYTYKKQGDKLEIYFIMKALEAYEYSNNTGSTDYYTRLINLNISNYNLFTIKYVSIKYDNINSDYTLESNEFVTEQIGQQILEQVYNKYKNGRKSVTLSVYADNYYDENGNIVYDKTKGEIIRNGDIIKLYEYKNNGYKVVGGENVRYKVTSSEFEYKGQPIIHLELLEEK